MGSALKFTCKFKNRPHFRIFVLYNKDLMTGRGNGKYGYKEGVRIEVEKYLREEMKKYFPSNRIAYIV